jgi:tetratricopeptide (TPR) repeat protein
MWLHPSNLQLEAQLQSATRQRSDSSLQWALEWPEFKKWHTDKFGGSILWISGGPGIGKSTMAAYFESHLNQRYSDSIIGCFFFKAGRPGLTKVLDMIRTIAFQVLLKSDAARSVLTQLKNGGFMIDRSLGIRLLCTRLLLEPLKLCGKKVFIILDGLDEVETEFDEIDSRPAKTEMDVFIDCVGYMAIMHRWHVLFLSRPESIVQDVEFPIIRKVINVAENAADVRKYVQNYISNRLSTNKQEWLSKHSKDPVQYFVGQSKGIFLWIVLAMGQLSGSRSKNDFFSRLDSITRAIDNMDALYVNILEKVHPNDRSWMQEILTWLIIAERPLTLIELKSIVEWTVGDQIDDFTAFVQIQCGSIVQLSPMPSGPEQIVQLIHETFYAFITERCRSDFRVCRKAAHGHATSSILGFLLDKDRGSDIFISYAAHSFVQHLANAPTHGADCGDILVNLRRFLDSEELSSWIKYGLLPYISISVTETVRVDFEESGLAVILKWLNEVQEKEVGGTSSGVYEALAWRRQILGSPGALGQRVGRAAGKLWMYDDFPEYEQIAACFALSVKHYLKTDGVLEFSTEEVSDLITARFEPLSKWIGGEMFGVKIRNIGVGFMVLKQWDSAIEWLMEATDDGAATEWLAGAYFEKKNYNAAIASYEKATGLGRNTDRIQSRIKDAQAEVTRQLVENADATKEGGTEVILWSPPLHGRSSEEGTDETAKARSGDTEKEPSTLEDWEQLALAHGNDIEAMIRVYRRGIDKVVGPSAKATLCLNLGNLYSDVDNAIESYLRGTGYCADSFTLWESLAYVYEVRGNTHARIQTWGNAVKSNPGNRLYLFHHALNTFQMGKFTEAVILYRVAIDSCNEPLDNWAWRLWDGLSLAYERLGDMPRAIKALQDGVKQCVNNWELYWRLGDRHLAMCNYKDAMKAQTFAIESYEKQVAAHCPDRTWFTLFRNAWTPVPQSPPMPIPRCTAGFSIPPVPQPWVVPPPATLRLPLRREHPTPCLLPPPMLSSANAPLSQPLSPSVLPHPMGPSLNAPPMIPSQPSIQPFGWPQPLPSPGQFVFTLPQGNIPQSMPSAPSAFRFNPPEYYVTQLALSEEEFQYFPNPKQFRVYIPPTIPVAPRLRYGNTYNGSLPAMNLSDASYFLGETLWNLGNDEEAAKAWMRAVELQPNHSAAWSRLGEAYRMKELHEKAVDAFCRALETDLQDEFPLNRLLELHRRKRKMGNESIRELRALYGFVNPWVAKPWFATVLTCKMLSEHENATLMAEKEEEWVGENIKVLKTTKGNDSGEYYHEILLALGELYMLKADYHNAVLTFEALARYNPKVLYVWEHLARAAKAKGDYNYSIWAYEQKIENTCGNARFATNSIPLERILHEDKCGNCARFMVRGILHRCKVCPFYNLCNNCSAILPRPHLEHDFLAVPSAQWIVAHCPSEGQCPDEESADTVDTLLGANGDSQKPTSEIWNGMPMKAESALLLQMALAQM